MRSILEKRLKWVEGIKWRLQKIENITAEDLKFSPHANVFGKCYVCGTSIVEHWFLEPNPEDKLRFEEKKKSHWAYRLYGDLRMPFLITGNKCGPALLEGEEKLKAKKLHREIQRQKRYARNLEKFKDIVKICEEMLRLSDIDKTGSGSYYKSDKERLEKIIYKCKVGSFNDYWLGKLNWIRRRHDLPEIERKVK